MSTGNLRRWWRRHRQARRWRRDYVAQVARWDRDRRLSEIFGRETFKPGGRMKRERYHLLIIAGFLLSLMAIAVYKAIASPLPILVKLALTVIGLVIGFFGLYFGLQETSDKEVKR